jgi:predicted XRE-type DNA-binding protein
MWEFFEQRTEVSIKGCWIWLGGIDGGGYGLAKIRKKTWKAHRLSYSIFVGQIPEGLDVLHKCDNPPCVRPSHLFPGTVSQNMQDCISKGRFRTLPGELNGNSKLTTDQALKIKEIRQCQKLSQRKIAEMFRITQGHVSRILLKKAWMKS